MSAKVKVHGEEEKKAAVHDKCVRFYFFYFLPGVG